MALKNDQKSKYFRKRTYHFPVFPIELKAPQTQHQRDVISAEAQKALTFPEFCNCCTKLSLSDRNKDRSILDSTYNETQRKLIFKGKHIKDNQTTQRKALFDFPDCFSFSKIFVYTFECCENIR